MVKIICYFNCLKIIILPGMSGTSDIDPELLQESFEAEIKRLKDCCELEKCTSIRLNTENFFLNNTIDYLNDDITAFETIIYILSNNQRADLTQEMKSIILRIQNKYSRSMKGLLGSVQGADYFKDVENAQISNDEQLAGGSSSHISKAENLHLDEQLPQFIYEIDDAELDSFLTAAHLLTDGRSFGSSGACEGLQHSNGLDIFTISPLVSGLGVSSNSSLRKG